jgi:hypothetical protein
MQPAYQASFGIGVFWAVAAAGRFLPASARRCCSLDTPICEDRMSTLKSRSRQLAIRRDSIKHAWVLVGGAAPWKPVAVVGRNPGHECLALAQNSDERPRQRYCGVE